MIMGISMLPSDMMAADRQKKLSLTNHLGALAINQTGKSGGTVPKWGVTFILYRFSWLVYLVQLWIWSVFWTCADTATMDLVEELCRTDPVLTPTPIVDTFERIRPLKCVHYWCRCHTQSYDRELGMWEIDP